MFVCSGRMLTVGLVLAFGGVWVAGCTGGAEKAPAADGAGAPSAKSSGDAPTADAKPMDPSATKSPAGPAEGGAPKAEPAGPNAQSPAGKAGDAKARDDRSPTEMVKPGSWGRSDLTARALAQRVDRAIRTAENVGGETWLNAEIRATPQQREPSRGYANAKVRVLDGKRFDVEYTQLGPEQMISGRLVADGSQRSRFLTGRGWDPLPSAEPALSLQGPALVQAWPHRFPMLMYAPLATSTNTWERLVSALERGDGGYRVKTERVVNQVQGRPRPQYRIVAERSADAAKRLGASRLEMRIDGVRFLPVTVLVDHRPVQGAHYNLNWTSSFRIGERFAPDSFDVPEGPMRPEVTTEPGL